MPARVRWTGSTTRRGYGSPHIKLRKALLARWQPGDPCAHCGRPMPDKRYIDLGHTADRAGYIGLAHRACNRADGARRGNRMRGAAKRWATARNW
jgi:hypothetical protein